MGPIKALCILFLQIILVASARASFLPLTELHYEVEVVGPLAEVQIEQVFTNTGETPVDALYVFPLQENAAVDAMRVEVEDRIIQGKIYTRAHARQLYRDAVATGKFAARTTQQRPNVFTQDVGNIPPGVTITVHVTVVQPVPRAVGAYELLLPLVVAPRFVPAGLPHEEWLKQVAETERSRVQAEIKVHAVTGFAVGAVECPSHRGTKLHTRDTELWADAAVSLHRDFRLRWRAILPAPQMVYFHDGEHGLLVVEPPSLPPDPGQSTPQELIFVLDSSGSMAGEPWALLKRTVHETLSRLNPHDRFQIVRFANDVTPFVHEAVPATPANIIAAHAYIDAIELGGGTNMYAGVRQAFQTGADPSRQRVVVFLSDGLIGTEEQTLQILEDYTGDTKIHSFAVGASPNRFMMQQIARLGGGRFQALSVEQAPESVAAEFVDFLERPVVSGLRVDWGPEAEVFPRRLPDLLVGQPQYVFVRGQDEEKPLVVTGHLAGRDWIQRLQPIKVNTRSLRSLWARAKLQDLQEQAIRDPDFDPAPEGTMVALHYQLLSPWTAFVAVDTEVRVQTGTSPAAGLAVRVAKEQQRDVLQYVPGGRSRRSIVVPNHSVGLKESIKSFHWTKERVFPTNSFELSLLGENSTNMRTELWSAWGPVRRVDLSQRTAGPLLRDHVFVDALTRLSTRDRDGETVRLTETAVNLRAVGRRADASARVGRGSVELPSGEARRHEDLALHAGYHTSEVRLKTDLSLSRRSIGTAERTDLHGLLQGRVFSEHHKAQLSVGLQTSRWQDKVLHERLVPSSSFKYTYENGKRFTLTGWFDTSLPIGGLGLSGGVGVQLRTVRGWLEGGRRRTRLLEGMLLGVEPRTDFLRVGVAVEPMEAVDIELTAKIASALQVFRPNGEWAPAEQMFAVSRRTTSVRLRARKLSMRHWWLDGWLEWHQADANPQLLRADAWKLADLIRPHRPFAARLQAVWDMDFHPLELSISAAVTYESAAVAPEQRWWLLPVTTAELQLKHPFNMRRGRFFATVKGTYSVDGRGVIDPWLGRNSPWTIGLGLTYKN